MMSWLHSELMRVDSLRIVLGHPDFLNASNGWSITTSRQFCQVDIQNDYGHLSRTGWNSIDGMGSVTHTVHSPVKQKSNSSFRSTGLATLPLVYKTRVGLVVLVYILS